ncbi:MAG: extracellular solute-binding protein [bacterium]
MKLTRRQLLKNGSMAAGAAAMGGAMGSMEAFAQGNTLSVVGATYNLREVILKGFQQQTGITVKPWRNASAQARADRLRLAPVDALESGADFMTYAWDEKLIKPIDLSRVPNWKNVPNLFLTGQETPDSPVGLGDNAGRLMWANEEKTQAKFLPYMYQFDSVGYNPEVVDAPNNELSWGELFNPKYRGKVALYGVPWLGILDAAMGLQALGVINPKDVTNLTIKEVDVVIDYLKDKKKEGHFRAFWKGFGELVNLMASREVVIADAWWPVITVVRKKGVPSRYAVAKEGYRAWAVGSCLSANAKNEEGAYKWFNYWFEGYAGAQQSKMGFYSPVDSYKKYLTNKEVEHLYGGKGRDGGSVGEKNKRIAVWNTKPSNNEYYTDKWQELLAT